MLVLSLVSLGVTLGAIYLSFRIKDDVFRMAMGFTAVLFGFLTLVCAPWLLKLVVIAIPFVLGLNRWSTENFN
jgi:hypothetical protein